MASAEEVVQDVERLERDHDRMKDALAEIAEIAEDRCDGAPDASREARAWNRVAAICDRGRGIRT